MFFVPDRGGHFNTHVYNPEHPQQSLIFGLTYAEESDLGGNKSYTIKEEYEEYDGTPKIKRTDTRIWDEGSTVIDDTPENRKVLESLYEKLERLIKSLKEFTKNENVLLQFIENSLKSDLVLGGSSILGIGTGEQLTTND
jgi:hypothetical protein